MRKRRLDGESVEKLSFDSAKANRDKNPRTEEHRKGAASLSTASFPS